MQNTRSETRRGFGSTLYIMCTCGVLNSVTTNKVHHLHKKGAPVFDVNTKAAVGKQMFCFRNVNVYFLQFQLKLTFLSKYKKFSFFVTNLEQSVICS